MGFFAHVWGYSERNFIPNISLILTPWIRWSPICWLLNGRHVSSWVTFIGCFSNINMTQNDVCQLTATLLVNGLSWVIIHGDFGICLRSDFFRRNRGHAQSFIVKQSF